MKKQFFTHLLIFYALQLKADCFDFGTRIIWPLGKVITNNSLVIIDTGDSNVVKDLQNKKYLYLKPLNGKGRIELTVIQICEGGLNFKQIILKPSIVLPEGVEYGLYYETTKPHNRKTNKAKNETPARTWLVKNNFDTEAPVWKKKPVIQNKRFVRYGCGSDVQVFLSYDATDVSEIIIEALIKNTVTGKQTTCYLKGSYGLIELGHNMCWGEFMFDNELDGKDEYEVSFILIDESGNMSSSSAPVRFIQPNPSDF